MLTETLEISKFKFFDALNVDNLVITVFKSIAKE